MGINFPSSKMFSTKQIHRKKQPLLGRNGENDNVPKGHIAVYVGEYQKKRHVVPISYVNHPLFLELLNCAEEEFGFNHPMGGLTIPCQEHLFLQLTEQLQSSS